MSKIRKTKTEGSVPASTYSRRSSSVDNSAYRYPSSTGRNIEHGFKSERNSRERSKIEQDKFSKSENSDIDKIVFKKSSMVRRSNESTSESTKYDIGGGRRRSIMPSTQIISATIPDEKMTPPSPGKAKFPSKTKRTKSVSPERPSPLPESTMEKALERFRKLTEKAQNRTKRRMSLSR